ncbi:DUF1659 domain-containing protein [Bacillus sp. REN16]|uniref:DUF1659 domain-containing protein n=1 Tax=Bacillus sp. REN16 TaxID=2887296 RepID=UPI001E4FC59C|nr:DUF1659 domain-containing protein [Bacillus sp. REN16]MCC3356164.1 DUF1659 domain-containing protein [Bacillus sp. REN16]
MAATQDILRTQLRFVFENGIDGKGRMILKNKNYNNINPEASADALHSVAVAIDNLQSLELVGIERNNSYALTGVGQ